MILRWDPVKRVGESGAKFVMDVHLRSYQQRRICKYLGRVDNMTKIKVNARVLRVVDGDTLEVKLKVRMADIDAPETKGVEKVLGEITKSWVKDRLEGKDVQLLIKASDIYYRALADVMDGSVNINQELLTQRLAEKYTPKNHNNGKLDI